MIPSTIADVSPFSIVLNTPEKNGSIVASTVVPKDSLNASPAFLPDDVPTFSASRSIASRALAGDFPSHRATSGASVDVVAATLARLGARSGG